MQTCKGVDKGVRPCKEMGLLDRGLTVGIERITAVGIELAVG